MTSSFSRRICTAIALSAFLTASADLSAQTYNVTKVVSNATPYPDGGYWIINYQQPPSIDGGKVYFFNSVSTSFYSTALTAIWSQDLTTGQQTRLLSNQDAAPGGVGNFTDLGAYTTAPVIRNGLMTMVTFDQSTVTYPLGWYTFQPGSGNAPNLVLNYNTSGFGYPANGGPSGLSTDGVHVSLTYGSNSNVFIANADGSGLLDPYYNIQFQVPTSCQVFPFAYWNGSSVSGNNVAFLGSDIGHNTQAIYVEPITGLPPSAVPTCFGQYDETPTAGPFQNLPGDPNTGAAANNISSSNFILDGNNVYYILTDKNAIVANGVPYACVLAQATNGNSPPVKIACNTDNLPGLLHQPFNFGGISESNGAVAFTASDQQDANGIRTGLYIYQSGNITKVVASGDVADGYTISSGLATNISISNTALENGVIAFWARASTDEFVDFVAQPAPTAAITPINQSGWVTPETITFVSSFGSLQNQFLIPDNGTGYVYAVPAGGGQSSNFATLGTPSSYFGGEGTGGGAGGVLINSGPFAGSYFVAGYNYTDPANGIYSGALFTVSPSGTSDIVYQAPGTSTTASGGIFGAPAVAPNGFGEFGGEILVPQLISNAIQLVTPTSATSASVSPFTTLNIAPFGLLFAPAGFGSVGGDLLVSGYDSGTILSVNSAGTVTTFATSTLASGQVGLREMAIAPAGFGTYGGDLFVSVGASTGGGGINGAVDVFNPQGELVAVLTQPTVGINFDPRGLYFANSGQVYICNSGQGLVVATPAAFTPAATISLENLLQTYTGSPASPVTVTTNPAGLSVAVTYSSSTYPSSATPPTAAGSYTVTVVITAAGYTGIATATLGIEKASASITLGNLAQTYTGSPATPVTATTNPSGLAVSLTYSGANYNTSTAPPTAAGSYLVTATITDPNYTGGTTGTLVISAAPTSPVTYLGLDSTTQGQWTGKYGSDGYQIANGATSLPAYATVSFSGDSLYTWAAQTTDPRALQTAPSSTTGIASTYYSNTSFNINLNLSDGNSHRVALYLLDWDTTARNETISILDATTHAVLDSESFSGFHNGQWAAWNIKGNVIIQVKSNIAYGNATISGIFFGPATSTTPPVGPPSSSSATYNGLDATTQGAWTGKYGGDGYQIANGATMLPTYATVSITGDATYTWAAQTTDPRALQTSSGSATGIASTYYANSSFDINLNLTDSKSHVVALYLLDFDTTARAETITIYDAATNTILDSESFSGFHNGQWAVWTIKGDVIIQVTSSNSSAAVVSGLFFGPAGSGTPPPPTPPTTASASYVGTDATTEGTWTGQYGGDGYQIANGASSLPAYATVSLTGDSTYTWAAHTTDPRALQTSSGASTRIASTYYATSTFNINLNLTDGDSHTVALYLLDFDTTARAETIKILDASSNAVLDSESFSGFHNGQWAVWTIKGNVIIQITSSNSSTAAVSGIFFGPAGSVTPPSPRPPAPLTAASTQPPRANGPANSAATATRLPTARSVSPRTRHSLSRVTPPIPGPAKPPTRAPCKFRLDRPPASRPLTMRVPTST